MPFIETKLSVKLDENKKEILQNALTDAVASATERFCHDRN